MMDIDILLLRATKLRMVLSRPVLLPVEATETQIRSLPSVD
jgi:hypothetical protein